MRPHGRAGIDPTRPRALAICQRCQAMVNHDTLRWQFQYGGLKLINLRLLVCPECYDQPQIQLRTIILPPDPQPIEFSLPEEYPGTDNPVSGVGYSPQTTTRVSVSGQTLGANIGTLTGGAGLNAAFDGNAYLSSAGTYTHKAALFSAASPSVSGSSFTNFIGKNWGSPDTMAGTPVSLRPTLTYNISSFTVIAPSDQPIIPVSGSATIGQAFDSGAFDSGTFDTVSAVSGAVGSIQLQGSNDGASWTVLYSSTLLGVSGEVFTSISSNLTTGNFQQHRLAISGDGSHTMYVSQVQFNVQTTGQNEE